MVTVWFIRHAQSEANAGLPTTHPVTTRLTDKGIQQAKHIALAIPEPPTLIVTSPYLRTQQTAAPTIERFPTVPRAEWQVQEFTFLTHAHYYNTTVHQRRPIVAEYWERCDPLHIDGEGAESFAALIERVEQLRSKIEQIEEGFILVFSHGRFIRAVLWSLLACPTEVNSKTMRQFGAFADSFKVPNGAILKTQFRGADVWFSSFMLDHLLASGGG